MSHELSPEEIRDIFIRITAKERNEVIEQYKAWGLNVDVISFVIHSQANQALRSIFEGKFTIQEELFVSSLMFFEFGYAYRLEMEKKQLEEELNATQD